MHIDKKGACERLQGKTALITGAASGIGRATACLFAGEGAKVVLADIDLARADEVATELQLVSVECRAVQLDVASESDWSSTMGQILSGRNQLDILVNCAGISDEKSLADLSLGQWRRVMSVNLDGVFLGTAAAIRAMTPIGKGSIVNVSSLSGIKASPGAAAYCCSKAAIIQLSRVAALECARDGFNIRVNTVAPGGVKTPMWERTDMWPDISTTDEWNASPDAPPLKRFAEADEIARAILFLASDESSYVSGSTLVVDGGASA